MTGARPGAERLLKVEIQMSKIAANSSRIHFSSGGIQFKVVAFRAEEQISRMFDVQIELASQEELQREEFIGQFGLLTIASGEEDRYFHGIVHEFHHSATHNRLNLYKAVLLPQAALLQHRQNCRIFQHESVVDIISHVLNQAGITSDQFDFRLQSQYAQREYCVQYCESDLNFIRRLLVQEGIFFFFEHSQDGHLLVFGDSPVTYRPIAGNAEIPLNPGAAMVGETETVYAFQTAKRILSGQYTQRDYNFEKPDMDLTARHQGEHHQKLEIYEYPGDYRLPEQGRRLARIRLEAVVMNENQAYGKSVVPRFITGRTFSLTGSGTDGHDGQYLLVRLNHTGEQPQVMEERSDQAKGFSYTNDFSAVPAEVIIRPDGEGLYKPVIQGSQSAMVTGPAHEEIYTDRHGRVKVQFHWDREGRRNEKSSCWLRVSQGWAGAGWGAMYIPRIGQEVLVDFMEGDPDRPLVTGRAYNGNNPPPCSLPADKTVSTLKSLSSPGGDGFNEVRFQDRKGQEQIFMHAEKDMDLRVKNDRRTFIGRDAHLMVRKDLLERVDGTYNLAVKADCTEQVQGDVSQTTGRDRQEKVNGNYGLEAGQEIHMATGGALVLESASNLTVKAGSSFIAVDNSGVSICGPKINLNSGGSAGSGRGVFTQSPLLPLEAGIRLPGFHEGNPSSPVPVLPPPDKGAAQSMNQVPPPENLYAKLRSQRGTQDRMLSLTDGYDLNGPWHLERPAARTGRYSTVHYSRVPAGGYSLALKPFDLEPEPLKAARQTTAPQDVAMA